MSNIGDIILDAMIKEAVIANFHDEMNAMPSEEQLRKEFAPSPEHVRKMKKLFAWEKRRDFTRKLLVHTKAAALVLCVATAVFFSALMFNPEVRASVRGAIVQFFELFARVEFAEPNKPDRETGSFVLGYIPVGYEQISREEFGKSVMTIYSDSTGNMLIFNINPVDSHAGDIEHSDYREETHAGITYSIYEAHTSEDYTDIVWVQDNFMFGLTGIISVEELIKMALSLE
jgi:hypothetical protein